MINYKELDNKTPEEKLVMIDNAITELHKISNDIKMYDNYDLALLIKLKMAEYYK